jgi:hypothetical protein
MKGFYPAIRMECRGMRNSEKSEPATVVARAPGSVSIGRLFVSRCPIRYAVKRIGEELESTPARGALKMVKDAVSWDRSVEHVL